MTNYNMAATGIVSSHAARWRFASRPGRWHVDVSHVTAPRRLVMHNMTPSDRTSTGNCSVSFQPKSSLRTNPSILFVGSVVAATRLRLVDQATFHRTIRDYLSARSRAHGSVAATGLR